MSTVQSGTGEGNGEKMWLEVRPEDPNRRCRSDAVWQIVPYMSSGNQKGSVTNGRQSSEADDQRWRWCRMQLLMSLDVRHLT